MKFFRVKTWVILTAALMLAGAGAVRAQSLIISTVAGYAGKGSNDGVGSGALFQNPQGVAVDGAGNVYVADTGNNTIRVITAAGVSSTLAGTPGVAGSADGTGASASFNQPAGLALDAATNIYVSDFGNNTIRKITLSGHVTTIAGVAGVAGSANATGTNATFYHPLGIAVDGSTNLYVADYGNQLIRKISPSLAVTTLAGAVGVAGTNNGTGTAAQFNNPEGVTVDSSGNVYVADTGNAAIRLVTSTGAVSNLAGSPGSLGSTDGAGTSALFYQPIGIAYNSSGGFLYVADYFENTIRTLTTGGTVVTVASLAGTTGSTDGVGSAARFWGPQGLAVGSGGTLYIADTGNSTIRTMNTLEAVTTLAGSPSAGGTSGAAPNARFYNPQNVALDSATNIYVADTQNSVIRKITTTGAVTVFAGTTGVFGSADGASALFSGPQGIAVDGNSNVYVADTGNSTVRKITPGGVTSTFAGSAGLPGNTDGTNTTVQFNRPEGVAVDSANNVYVADTYNFTIRKITPGGVSSTLAGLAGTSGSFDGTNTGARFNCPAGVAVDSSGNLYVSDYNNNTIREVSPAGVVTTLAGWAGVWGNSDGTGTNASFYGPTGITVDASDNVFVIDSGNNTLRKVTQAGVVTTVAGLAGVSGSSDGTGTAAKFYYPAGVAFAGGYVYVADAGNNTIRSQCILPSIITQPQSQTTSPGNSVTFSVSVYGSSPLTYLWQYNTTNLPFNSSSILASNAGTYQVTISNAAGHVLSSPATLILTNSAGVPGVFQSYAMLNNGWMQFNLTGTSGATYTLMVSTNLMTWSNLATFSMTNGAIIYTDPTATNFRTRFYKLASP